MKLTNLRIACFLALIFFVAAVLTLTHYGINWDTINHLPRGQAYLHYFLTGKKDYSDIDPFKLYWQKADTLKIDTNLPKEQVPTRSMYQEESNDFNYFMERDGGGHPPLSDILSATFNRVLFSKLRLVNDVDAYRIYGILLAAALVGLIYYWVSSKYGVIAGLVSSLSLSLYPLFWSESHFNTEKDIPEAVYWSFFLFSFWKGVVEKRWKWLIGSGIFAGLALGTKFNILFSAFVVFPWLLIYFWDKRNRKDLKEFISNKILLASLVLVPIIAMAIFIGTWPYLWQDIISGLMKVFGFYKTIGTTTIVETSFTGPFGINFLPLFWIIYITPPLILLAFILGITISVPKVAKEKDKVFLLFILWVLVPVVRGVWPGTTIYGGVRQLMEYIPAMAAIAGIGGSWVFNFLTKKVHRVFAIAVLILLFVFLTFSLYKIHPNENAYFNFLIGGLSGAKERDFPHWGLTFGAPYRQGVNWINKNAEMGGRISFAFELIPNFPRIWLRDDLTLFNTYRSGYLQESEYVITLISQGVEARSYFDMFLNKFVEPLYEVKADGVSLLKVWRNDKKYLRVSFKEELDNRTSYKKVDTGIRFDLEEAKDLARLEISYREGNCPDMAWGYTQISQDGESWERLPGVLPEDWRVAILGQQPKDGYFIEPFVGQKARYIDLVLAPPDTCLVNVDKYKIYYYSEL